MVLTKFHLTSKYQTLFKKANVDSFLRISHFLAQAQHESGLKPKQENLNYSVKGLLVTFGRHRISREDCYKYGRKKGQKANQKAIANLVYGGKWGIKNLGNKYKGDGWKFRGRGIFQITGRYNYQQLTNYAQNVLGLDVDYIENPDLLLREADSLIAALWYWNSRNLNKYADQDDILAISQIINLGSLKKGFVPNGYRHRRKCLIYFKNKLR